MTFRSNLIVAFVAVSEAARPAWAWGVGGFVPHCSSVRSFPSRCSRFPRVGDRAAGGRRPDVVTPRTSFSTRMYTKKKGGESTDGGPKKKAPKAKGRSGVSGSNKKHTKKGGGGKKAPHGKKKFKKEKSGKQKKGRKNSGGNILELIDPFKAGQKVRAALDRTVETAVSITTLSPQAGKSKKSIYYLDDRLMEPGEGPAMFAERNPLFDRLSYGEDTLPEVLVVGATGEVGRLLVRRLLLDGRFRVRVLVRDLYSDTLNLLGTGVTYCQGDLGNVESLEYAVTDVDKIVFCAGAPRPDEDNFRRRFQEFSQENLLSDGDGNGSVQHDADSASAAADAVVRDRKDGDRALLLAAASAGSGTDDQSDEEWQRMQSVMEVRSRLAEQIDLVGMQNLIRAYQNVRHADYGTSQAAKRSLFKFQRRPGDFELFSVEGDEEKSDDADVEKYAADAGGDVDSVTKQSRKGKKRKKRKGGSTTAQCGWIRNKFGHGVFVGSVPNRGGQASVVSGRLSSRENPESGIDLSAGGFGGFVARLCSDGRRYEAFIRTGDYDADGTEYVCEFDTGTKSTGAESSSTNRFVTVRLPFSQFRPVKNDGSMRPDASAKSFDGSDVRQIGFRYRGGQRSLQDALSRAQASGGANRYSKFYLSLSYIKVYRHQPEPEFVYVSDARIPPVVWNGMVRHDARRIVEGPTAGDSAEGGGVSIFDEEEVRKVSEDKDRTDRSGEETYYKYRGEEVLRHSGLSYTIIRVAGYSESPVTQSGSIHLQQSDKDVSAVSRAEVAQVCANALLDPEACNTISYLTRSNKKGGSGPTFSRISPDS